MFDPALNLPDDTLIEMVRLSPLIRKSLNAAGLKTIGEIRAMSDDKLRTMRGIGTGSLAYLRKTIGTGLKAKQAGQAHDHPVLRLRRADRRHGPGNRAADRDPEESDRGNR
jgi:hypothetical protein